jgi:hypothetical protein
MGLAYDPYSGLTSITEGTYLEIPDILRAQGTILQNFGTSADTYVAGTFLAYDGGIWKETKVNVDKTSITLIGVLLRAVATGDPVNVLIEGIVSTTKIDASSYSPGYPIFISPINTGCASDLIPTTTGEFVRGLGHYLGDDGGGLYSIFFKPDVTWIAL